MAYPASKQFSYIAQLGILIAFIGAGLIIGTFASVIPLLGKIDLNALTHGSKDVMSDILKPENANALRWVQFISTLFLIFLPAFFYAWVCHKKAFTHLGYNHQPDVKEIGLVLLIMFSAMPLVSVLSDLTAMLPFSKATFQHFKEAEDEYNKQVAVIARMNNVWDYISSMIVIAFLPALFEETLFRGALQNLLSRWTKMPVLSIVISAAIFSAVHGSYLGFLSRFALGFILGWFYYRTGNIWLNITGHFFNNALAVTALYITTRPNVPLDPSQADTHFSLWIGLVSLAAVYGLLQLFDTVSKKDIDHPGEEVLITAHSDNPFLTDINNIGNSN
jgi:membrane protease YdiL (CAAX protease family)